MELDITDFFTNAAPMDYSASAMELGNDAGRITWQAACDDAADYPLLDTADKQAAAVDYFAGFGAWERTELEAMTQTELTALLMQFIAGDIRESGIDTDMPDWQAYEASENAGRFYRGDDGRIYFYLGE